MPFEGMDADQLRGLATRIDSDAQTLSGLVTTMTGVLAELTLFWYGPMVAVFEQDWQAKHRPSLLAAHDILTGLHTHLVSNIDQQISASAAEGVWTAERVVGDFENLLTGAGLAGMTKLLDGTRAGGVLDGLGYVGMAIGAYQTGHEMFDTGEEVGEGNYVAAANDFTEGVADGLQTYPSPVTFFLGTDLKLADDVANLDWKDTPNPLSGSNWEQDYVPVFKSMVTSAFWEQAGETLWGAM
jgi:hypothetical protein